MFKSRYATSISKPATQELHYRRLSSSSEFSCNVVCQNSRISSLDSHSQTALGDRVGVLHGNSGAVLGQGQKVRKVDCRITAGNNVTKDVRGFQSRSTSHHVLLSGDLLLGGQAHCETASIDVANKIQTLEGRRSFGSKGRREKCRCEIWKRSSWRNNQLKTTHLIVAA